MVDRLQAVDRRSRESATDPHDRDGVALVVALGERDVRNDEQPRCRRIATTASSMVTSRIVRPLPANQRRWGSQRRALGPGRRCRRSTSVIVPGRCGIADALVSLGQTDEREPEEAVRGERDW